MAALMNPNAEITSPPLLPHPLTLAHKANAVDLLWTYGDTNNGTIGNDWHIFMKAMLGLHPELTSFCGSPCAGIAKTAWATQRPRMQQRLLCDDASHRVQPARREMFSWPRRERRRVLVVQQVGGLRLTYLVIIVDRCVR